MQRRRKFMGHLPQKGTCMFGESDGTVPRDVLIPSNLAGGIELHESHSTIAACGGNSFQRESRVNAAAANGELVNGGRRRQTKGNL